MAYAITTYIKFRCNQFQKREDFRSNRFPKKKTSGGFLNSGGVDHDNDGVRTPTCVMSSIHTRTLKGLIPRHPI